MLPSTPSCTTPCHVKKSLGWTKRHAKRCLDSLNYDGMNDRQSTIKPRHNQTFDWIFKDIDAGRSSDMLQAGQYPQSSGNLGLSEEVQGSDNQSASGHVHDADRKSPLSGQEGAFIRCLRADARRLFWISGKPGSGKSTLMKLIRYDQRTANALEKWRPKPRIISHFLWKAGSQSQNSFRGLLCSLLHQVLHNDQHLIAQFIGENRGLTYKNSETDWSLEELKVLLFKGIRNADRGYLVLLDALDEVDRRDEGLDQLLNFVHELEAESQVKLCVSSRAERPFDLRFDNESRPRLRMEHLTYQDIKNYTHDFLKNTGLDSPDLLQKISEEILWKVEGVFIWVYLVLADVKLGITNFAEDWDEIYQRITIFQPDLMKLYRDMWHRLDGRREVHVARAAKYFSLVRMLLTYGRFRSHCCVLTLAIASDDAILGVFSASNELPLLPEVLQRCEHIQKTLSPTCAGLLEMEDGWGAVVEGATDQQRLAAWDEVRIRFTHKTALEFLDSDEGQALFQSFAPDSEETVFRCVKAVLIIQFLHGAGNRAFTQVADSMWQLKESCEQLKEGFQPSV
ncbi:hypothetical protein BDP81DRAFT_416782 [Colletotrichum phormii]|uniref:NACHT domain-containing protein n=1 Tax=Colletotrichum phormii TaxID=359342 RepID=A0AAJ0A1U0_9PEZI|nr:uncharacterized protein BDP81DRAFT_416782 [Colletotrichum phormii]KAK1654905.1 hypothetical protein BDP81DRAFT_416782 [Colletotrichum phormii]